MGSPPGGYGKLAETGEHMTRIRKGVKAFASIKRKAFFLTGKNDATGNPAQILMDYLRMVFHLDILVYNSVLREVRGKSEEIMGILDSLGELDALISVASSERCFSVVQAGFYRMDVRPY